MTHSFNRAAIESHVTRLHELAAGIQGVIPLFSVEEGRDPKVQRFRVGNAADMVGAIMAFENRQSFNVYIPWAVMRRDLEPNRKGAESDIVAVLAAVADLDHDKYSLGELPFEAPYIIESSSGNYQTVYPFARPLPVSEAKPILAALSGAIGGDSATKDCSHVWRIPGTLNWPTKPKLARGRSPEPQPVTVKKAFDGTLVNPKELAAKLPKKANGHAAHDKQDLPEALSDWEEELLRDALDHIPADGYYDWLHVGMALHTVGLRTLWDEWSATSDKFNAAEQARKWKSFNAEREGNIVTTGTIYKLAGEHGWTARPLFGDELFSENEKRAANRANSPEVFEPDDDEADPGFSGGNAGGGDDAPRAEGETKQQEPGARLLNVVDAGSFEGKDVPDRMWHVDVLIPARNVTLLSGDGGVGKSLLALQLAVSTTLGESWCGLPVAQGSAVFLTAEDEIDELHRRLKNILGQYIYTDQETILGSQYTYTDLAGKLWLISLCNEDALLAVPSGQTGPMTPTKLCEAVRRVLLATKPKMLVLDTAADLFGGDEIKRNHVRGFISILRKIAIEFDCAIVLLSHPSQSGMASGGGSSGSTAWNNSVRSRLYFVRNMDRDGHEEDSDIRVLNSKKSNYGPAGAAIRLRYVAGAFVVVDEGDGLRCVNPKDEAKRVDEIFMTLIDVFERRCENVSNALGPTFAPARFAGDPLSKGVPKKSLQAAMNRLLDAEVIVIDKFGPPSRQRTRLIRKRPELVKSKGGAPWRRVEDIWPRVEDIWPSAEETD